MDRRCGVGNVLCLENTVCERTEYFATCHQLPSASQIHYSMSSQSRYQVSIRSRSRSHTHTQTSISILSIPLLRSPSRNPPPPTTLIYEICRHLATCSADTTIKLWSTSNYEYTLERTLAGHQRWVWDAAFSADSAYLVTGTAPGSSRELLGDVS